MFHLLRKGCVHLDQYKYMWYTIQQLIVYTEYMCELGLTSKISNQIESVVENSNKLQS